MPTPIATETQALLDAIVPTNGATTKTTDDLYAAIAPLHAALALVNARIVEIDRLRRAADASETADYAYAFFERIKQTTGAMLREASAAGHALDRLTDSAFQLDQYAIQMKTSLNTRDERLAAADARTAGTVTLSAAEHAHLLDRANAGTAAIKAAALETTVAQPLPLGDTA